MSRQRRKPVRGCRLSNRHCFVGTSVRTFPCSTCSAPLQFAADTSSLSCPYCGSAESIPSEANVEELDFHTFLQRAGEAATSEALTIACASCGASTTHGANVVSTDCPYCAAPLVMTGKSQKLIQARSLLPFGVEERQAKDAYQQWIQSRWFAPNALKARARQGKIQGVYIPYWTYDSDTSSEYSGQRGDYYWDTETYTTTENGKSVTRTRRVRKTRWTYTRGRVSVPFDDVLVLAARSLQRKYYDQLEPWDLQNLVDYDDRYLSGFRAETYGVTLEQGFDSAKEVMQEGICTAIRGDIGGDKQRIHSVDTSYYEITFKHILLPVWISSYRFQDKIFHVLVNGRTGEVQGERPWSVWKILCAVLLAVAGGILIFVAGQTNR